MDQSREMENNYILQRQKSLEILQKRRQFKQQLFCEFWIFAFNLSQLFFSSSSQHHNYANTCCQCDQHKILSPKTTTNKIPNVKPIHFPTICPKLPLAQLEMYTTFLFSYTFGNVTIYGAQRTIYGAQRTIYGAQRTFYGAQRTFNGAQRTTYLRKHKIAISFFWEPRMKN